MFSSIVLTTLQVMSVVMPQQSCEVMQMKNIIMHQPCFTQVTSFCLKTFWPKPNSFDVRCSHSWDCLKASFVVNCDTMHMLSALSWKDREKSILAMLGQSAMPQTSCVGFNSSVRSTTDKLRSWLSIKTDWGKDVKLHLFRVSLVSFVSLDIHIGSSQISLSWRVSDLRLSKAGWSAGSSKLHDSRVKCLTTTADAAIWCSEDRIGTGEGWLAAVPCANVAKWSLVSADSTSGLQWTDHAGCMYMKHRTAGRHYRFLAQ